MLTRFGQNLWDISVTNNHLNTLITLMDYFSIFTVIVEEMPEFKLKFKAGDDLSINSSTGAVILQEKNEPLLYTYWLQQDGSYSNEWRRQCPENKHWGSCFLTDAGDIILHDNNGLTYLFDQDMKLMDSWQHQGSLVACLSGLRTVYSANKGMGYVIDIRSLDGEILQLNPEGSTYGKHFSGRMCEDERTKKKVVVNRYHRATMDIFLQDGKSQHILYLLFMHLCM